MYVAWPWDGDKSNALGGKKFCGTREENMEGS